MTEYYTQRPNMYTGTANVSVPLYTIDFDGWKLPMSLSYNATGVRANEDAGEVGLGWSSNWTGVISRTIRGSDDFSQPSSGFYQGYVYNAYPIPTNFNLGYDYLNINVTTVPILPPQNSYYYWLAATNPDIQPDIFNYNFFGYSGSFVLTQKAADASGQIKVIKLTKDACSILFDETNKNFSVITPEGYKGDFTVKELSTTISTGAATWLNVSNNTCWGENFYDIQACKNYGRFETVSSWYLYQITSPRGQKVTFTYDMTNGRSSYISNTRSNGEITDPHGTPIVMETVHEHVYLTNILSEEVNINFSMEIREDLRQNTFFGPNSSNPQFPASQLLKRYTGFVVTGVDPSSTLNKHVVFKQSYFNQQYQDQYQGNQSDTELLWLRSRLDRVAIDDQEYRFYYNNGLPQKLTNAIDHFGFYNHNDNNTFLTSPQVIPGPGTTTCSLSPPTYTIVTYYQQYQNRQTNFAYGVCGLLTKVRYPTRGYSLFNYEAHDYLQDTTGVVFREQGGGQGGGARIQSIKEYDYDGTLILSKAYQYTQVPNMVNPKVTTGKLMTPLFNRYVQFGRNPFSTPAMLVQNCWNVYTSGSSIPGNNAADGKIIGYSKVFEFVQSTSESYMNAYYFENRPNKVLAGSNVVAQFPNLNGQGTEIRNYNSLGNIVQRTVNENYYHAIDSIPSIVYGVTSNDASNSIAYTAFKYYTGTFVTPWKITTYRGVSTTGFTDSDVANTTIDVAKQGKATKSVKTVTYNLHYLLASEQDSTSNGDILSTAYLHPVDYGSGFASPTLLHMRMSTVNIISPVIEEIRFKNAQAIYGKGNQYFYDSLGSKQVNLTATYLFNNALSTSRYFSGTSDGYSFSSSSYPYEINNTYSKYDAKSGKLQEFSGRDGVVHAFVWGYNKKLPIVHGIGTTYSQLYAAYKADSASTTYETSLRNDPNIAGKQITTYVHNPLVGVTKITDPTGNKTTFAYDSYGRLVLAKDNSDHILSQNKYHFKTMLPTRTLSASTTSISFGTFYDCHLPSPATLTLTNSGEDDLPFTLTMPNGFSTTLPQGIGTLYAGTSIDIPVSFTGGPSNTPYTGSIAINAPTRTDVGGVSGVSVSATFLPSGTTRATQLTPNPLIFAYANQNQNVTITNTGNECLTLAGTTSLASNDPDWSANVPAIVLAPNESTTMTVYLKNSNPTGHTITVNDDQNSGNNVLSVDIQRASLGVPSAFNFASFTTTSSTQSFIVTNTGAINVSVTSITGTDSHFTNVTPQVFTLTPGNSQAVSVTYTATDFLSQSSLLSIFANTQSGTSVNVTAQQTKVYQLTMSPNSVTIKPSQQTQSSYLTNTGNVPVVINSVPSAAPAGFAVTYLIYSGGTWVAVNPNSSPVTLQVGGQLQIQVTTATSGVFSSATGQLTLFDTLSNSYTLNLVRSPTP